PGISKDAANVFYLRSLDDARKIRARMLASQRVAIIGGGFLGLEFATAALSQGLEVTVFEAADYLLGRVAPRLFGDWLLARYQEAGVNIRSGAKLSSVTPEDHGVTIDLEGGVAQQFDFVVVSIGQVPNIELAKDAGI